MHAAGNAGAVALGIDFGRTSFASLTTSGERLLFWLYRSHHGVFLFFVLSGFLIGRMWWPRPTMSYARFAWRRTLRIYPAFLLAFAASLMFAWRSGTWTPPDFARLAGNLFFLNGAPGLHVEPFNIVTWSLFYEMTFYVAFPALAVAALAVGPRGGRALAIAGIAAPAAMAGLGADALVMCWSLLFFGVALAVSEDALRAIVARVPGAAIAAAYLAVTTAAMLDALPAIAAILAFGLVTLALVAKSLAAGNVITWALTLRPLRALGRVSYSFYLVHWMLVVLVARAVDGALRPMAATLVVFVGGFTLSAAAAAASWWLAERRYFKWVQRE